MGFKVARVMPGFRNCTFHFCLCVSFVSVCMEVWYCKPHYTRMRSFLGRHASERFPSSLADAGRAGMKDLFRHQFGTVVFEAPICPNSTFQ